MHKRKEDKVINKFSNGEYIVIEGKQLADVTQDEYFWKRGSEVEYKKFLEDKVLP